MLFQGIKRFLYSELWVQLGESATAHVHLGLEELAGNPVRLSEATELPSQLVRQSDLKMLDAISAPVSSCFTEKQYISKYLSKIWVFMGFGFYWWILHLIVFRFFLQGYSNYFTWNRRMYSFVIATLEKRETFLVEKKLVHIGSDLYF